MNEFIKGKAWKFGNDLDMDSDIFPFKYVLELSGGATMNELAHHVMESANPDFGKNVEEGDFFVAGKNLGLGKAHLEGVEALKLLGISAVIAESIAPGFFRNALFFALPVLLVKNVSDHISQGDQLAVNLKTGEVKNLTTQKELTGELSVSEGHPLYPIMKAGGQVEYIRKKVAETKTKRGVNVAERLFQA